MTMQELNLPTDLRDALDAAVAKIVEIADPEVVILFGSWAEGRATEDSDVDLLVVVDTEDSIRFTVSLRKAIGPLLDPREFDLVVIAANEWPRARRLRGFVTHEADRYGVRMYDRAA